MNIILNKFPTHLAKTNNKVKANKMQKLNGQSIYNGAINRFTRAKIMENMHNYLIGAFMPHKEVLQECLEEMYPIEPEIHIHTVINHGDISMRSGKICWKPAEPDYEPRWDIYNLASIWIKAIEDALSKSGIIPDDNVKYIRGGRYKFTEVKDIEDRKIIIKFKE
jgi:hypothetical protein